MRETRCRCRSLDSISISVWNSFTPCSDDGFDRLIATLVPPSTTPLYTFPNPPTPITSDSSKFFVACRISPTEKCRHKLTARDDRWLLAALLPEMVDRLVVALLPAYSGSHPPGPPPDDAAPAILLFRLYTAKQRAHTRASAAAPPTAPPMTPFRPPEVPEEANCASASRCSASTSMAEGEGLGPARLPFVSLILKTSSPLRTAS